MANEIERKFLVDRERLPEGWRNAEAKKIVQGYVALAQDGTEVRLRQKGSQYFLTVKSSGGLLRQEGEIEIRQDQFDTLWPFTAGRRLEKVRYTLDEGGYHVELDIYSGALEGLATAEVEFPSIEASERFPKPFWLVVEKTADERYKNKNLALSGKVPD